MMTTTRLPTYPDGRIRWREFYDSVRPGDRFILPADMLTRVNASRRDCRYKIKAARNRDGQTMTLTVRPPATDRAALLETFRSLSNKQLRGVIAACKTHGLLPS